MTGSRMPKAPPPSRRMSCGCLLLMLAALGTAGAAAYPLLDEYGVEPRGFVFESCQAAYNADAWPVYRGEVGGGYQVHLDPDGNGIGCEEGP